MPLLDLKTDLKSLKYGQDRPGGGNSGQPYVQYPLPEVASQQYLDFYQNNKFNLDFPLRGGGSGLGDRGPYIAQAAKYDRIRIEKFLKDAPRGPIFLLKQTALQLSNPKIQVGSQINLALGTQPLRFLGNLENTRIYNGGKNTLAQVGVQGSGFHFDRHGNVPINPFQQTYSYVANDRIQNNSTRNRLLVLYSTKIERSDRISLNDPTTSIETLNILGISRDSGLLFQYPGGPSSVGGIGLTTIHRRYISRIPTLRTTPSYTSGSTESGPSLQYLFEKVIQSGSNTLYNYNVDSTVAYAYNNKSVITIPRTGSTDLNQGSTTGTTSTINFGYALNYQQLLSRGEKNTNATIGQDFRLAIRGTIPQAKDKLAATPGYEGTGINNLETKYGIGNPGTNQLKRVRYNESVNSGGAPISSSQDVINMLDVGITGDTLDEQGHLRDLITFRFDTIEINEPTPTVPIVFRAFLNSIQDNHSADYTPFKYVGRGENFYTYNGFNREISFNFKIAAQSRAEMRPLYRKLNFLLSQLYPDYRRGTGFMRAPITKLTIGDYIYRQPGFLRGLNVTIPDDSPWEIANNQIKGADNEMYQLPHYLEVSCQFTPIHDFLPRRGRGTGDSALIPPFITPNTPPTNRFGIGKL